MNINIIALAKELLDVVNWYREDNASLPDDEKREIAIEVRLYVYSDGWCLKVDDPAFDGNLGGFCSEGQVGLFHTPSDCLAVAEGLVAAARVHGDDKA